MSLKDRVGLIDLAVPSDRVDPDTCSVYGWGCDSVGSSVQDTIQKGNLPLVSDERCESIWHVDMSKRVCAGGRGTESACHVSYLLSTTVSHNAIGNFRYPRHIYFS